MKDLFLKNSGDNSAVATLRCEMFSNTAANMEVLEITLPNGKKADYVLVGNKSIQRLPYSLPAFIALCTTGSVIVTSSESNGKNPVQLN